MTLVYHWDLQKCPKELWITESLKTSRIYPIMRGES